MENTGNPQNTRNSLLIVLGSECATVGIRGMPQGGFRIQGHRLRLKGKSGLWVVASPHCQPDLIPHGIFLSSPGGLLSTGGLLGSRGFWGNLVPGTMCTSWACSWVRVPSSGPGVLRATPESEGSLIGHQPAPLVTRGSLFCMCTTMSSVVLIINLLFLCLS